MIVISCGYLSRVVVSSPGSDAGTTQDTLIQDEVSFQNVLLMAKDEC